MLLKELASLLLLHGAPILASLLGSPLAHISIELLASHFDIGNKYDLDGIAKEINKDPAKLAELELKHKEALISLMVDLLEKEEGINHGYLLAFMLTFTSIVFIAFITYFTFHR